MKNWKRNGLITAILILTGLPLVSSAQTDIEDTEFDFFSFVNRNLNTGKMTPEEIVAQAEDFLAAEEREEGMSFTACRFYAPDDKGFIIFQTEWEGCGAYCNTWFENLLAMPLGNGQYHLGESDIDWVHIDSLRTMPGENEWLVFSHSGGRPRGVEGVTCTHARLVWLSKTLQTLWQFDACTSSLVEIEYPVCEMSYLPEKQEIHYTYDWYEEEDDFRPYRVTGKWKYEGGSFKEIKKKQKDL